MSERPTKERILDAAEEIMLEKSFHSVGLNEILKAVNVPKGSFYHHFESKEQFGVELLKHYVDDASAYKRRVLLSTDVEPDPRKRLLTYYESMIAKFLEHEGKCPCLVVKLASEVADFSEPMRKVLADAYVEWGAILESAIREAVEKGRVREDVDPATTSKLAGNFWMGAMQQAIIGRNAESLREALAYISEHLLPEA